MWAGIWLGVKSAILRIVILAVALRAHRKSFHRSVRAIVRQGLDDRESRPAIGAVREGIAVPAIPGIKNVASTICADGNIGQYQNGLAAALVAVANIEILVTGRVEK